MNFLLQSIKFEFDLYFLIKGNYVRLADIERKLSKPPPIRESALVLIKQYPDKIHVRTELSTGHTLLGISMIGQSSAFYESKLVPIPKEIMQLPTFEAGSVLSGTMNPPVDTYDFDWDAYSDLDSVGFDAGAIVMPDTIYNIAIFHAYACWPDGDSFNPPNPFADVFWNGRRTGLTPLRCFDFTPGWVTCKIQMRQGPKEDITNCHLRINLFSFRSSSTCVLLGTISFDGPQLKDLLSPQISARIEQFQLQTFKPSSRAMQTITSASRNPEAEKKEEIVDKARGDATDTPVEEADVAYNADLDAEAAAKADKDFPHLALEEQDGQFETGNATIKIAILHCEFEVRVQFCQALVNSEGSDVSPFVIVIFNGRDIGMTDVKAGETWPVWVNPSAYSMKIGTLDIFECSLNVEVWQMGTTGRENLLGQVVFSGKQFVDLVGEASTRFIRHIKELSMPIVRGKDKDAKAASAGKAPKKAKAIASYGKVCFDIGPVGLPSAVDQEFELSIISGVNLSGENVYCQVHWNYVSLGNTTSATYVDPIADKATGETATAEGNPSADVAHIPPWTWGTNKFLFSCSSEEDALKNSSLKIYLVDAGEKTKLKPGDKPVVVKLGCISLTGDALVDFLTTENSLAATTKLDFARDPDESRPQRPPRGYLTVRRGPRGARMEGERTLVVHAARLTLIDLNVASAVAPRPRVARTSLNVDDGSVAAASAAPHEFGYYINAYFNDQSIGSSAHCIADEDVDPFWSDAWFQLPVNGQALKECSVRLELMMYRVISAPHENELSALGETSTGGGGGSSSLKKGISSSKLSSTNDMLKPGEGLPFVVATLTLSGNELKAVVGSKLTTRSEKELEPIAVTKASKSKKVDKFNLKPEALQTHSLKSGLILVGSPGSAVASPLDILRAEGKILAEKFNEYATNKLPVVVGKVTEQPEKAGDFDQGAALDNVAPAKDSNENDHEVPEIGPAFEDRKMDSESEKMDNVGNGADQLTVQAQVAVEALPGTDFKNTLTDDEIPVIVEGGS